MKDCEELNHNILSENLDSMDANMEEWEDQSSENNEDEPLMKNFSLIRKCQKIEAKGNMIDAIGNFDNDLSIIMMK